MFYFSKNHELKEKHESLYQEVKEKEETEELNFVEEDGLIDTEYDTTFELVII